jgi:hypothetical protein
MRLRGEVRDEVNMAEVRYENGTFDVDAEIIGRGLGLEPERIPAMMRNGEIGSGAERGEDEDAGRYRLTFVHGNDRFHLIVDEDGRILQGAPPIDD